MTHPIRKLALGIFTTLSVAACASTADAQQYLAQGPQGIRYYSYANPGPYYRGVSPGPYYRGGGGGPDIGNIVGAVIGGVMANALRPRYVPPPQQYAVAPPVEAPAQPQRRAPTQDQWRQSLLAGAAAFCRQYPTDQFCGPADQPAEVAPEPPTASPPVQTAPMPVEPPTGSAPARPYLQR